MKTQEFNISSACEQCNPNEPCPLMFKKSAKGTHFPNEKFTKNCLFFMRKGEMLINSKEYPGTILQKNQIIVQAIDSKVELLALTDVEFFTYSFIELKPFCTKEYRLVAGNSKEPLIYSPLKANKTIKQILDSVDNYLHSLRNEEPPCCKYLELKSQELIFWLLKSYPIDQLSRFFYPVIHYAQSFQFFILNNYMKVKNAEELAHKGGYSISTFRRLFKNLYGEPVYVWMTRKKSEDILHDLQYTDDKIGDLCERYKFDSLSHFSHFCTANFGDSPRSLRKRLQAGEKISYNQQKIRKRNTPQSKGE